MFWNARCEHCTAAFATQLTRARRSGARPRFVCKQLEPKDDRTAVDPRKAFTDSTTLDGCQYASDYADMIALARTLQRRCYTSVSFPQSRQNGAL